MKTLLCTIIVAGIMAALSMAKRSADVDKRTERYLDGYNEGIKRGYEIGQKGKSIADKDEIELLYGENGA